MKSNNNDDTKTEFVTIYSCILSSIKFELEMSRCACCHHDQRSHFKTMQEASSGLLGYANFSSVIISEVMSIRKKLILFLEQYSTISLKTSINHLKLVKFHHCGFKIIQN